MKDIDGSFEWEDFKLIFFMLLLFFAFLSAVIIWEVGL